MEAVLRTAADQSGSSQLFASEMQALRGFEGVKTALVRVAEHRTKVAVVHGIANLKRFLAEIQQVGLDKCGYHFIEVMVCPGGCIGGGGQVTRFIFSFT